MMKRERPTRRVGVIAIAALLIGALLGAGLALAATTDLGPEGVTQQDPRSTATKVSLESEVAFVGTTQAPLTPSPAATLRLAVVAPGTAQDRSFTQSMTDATAELLHNDEVAEVVVIENVDPSEAESRLRQLAAEDFDLVVAHSSTYRTAAFAVAVDFPTVTFAVAGTDDPTPGPNVYSYTVAAEQGGYLLGVISALSNPTDVVGVVGSVDVGTSGRFVDGFHNGAHSQQADQRVLISYAGFRVDAETAASTAMAHIDDGAGVIVGHGLPFDEAIRLAADRGVVWLGNETNPATVAPTNVAAAQVYDWGVVLRPIMVDLQAGTADGRHLLADLRNGGVFIEYNPGRPVPPATTARVDELAEEIMAGSLDPLASP